MKSNMIKNIVNHHIELDAPFNSSLVRDLIRLKFKIAINIVNVISCLRYMEKKNQIARISRFNFMKLNK